MLLASSLEALLPGYRPATTWVHYTTSCNTQSSAPEDGRNYRPKHVELIGIIKKLLLLHLVGCLYYLYQWCTVKQTLNHQLLIRKVFHGVVHSKKLATNLCQLQILGIYDTFTALPIFLWHGAQAESAVLCIQQYMTSHRKTWRDTCTMCFTLWCPFHLVYSEICTVIR